MLWQRPPSCATPNWMHPPASSWMLLTSLWELCYNSRSTRSGVQFPTFHGSCVLQSGGIAHLTGNYWPSTLPSAISATLWKVASSMYSRTTNHSLLLFPPSPGTFRPDGRGIWSSSPSLPQTSGISKGLPTLRLMHSPTWMWVPCTQHPLPLTSRPWPKLNRRTHPR